MDKSPQTQSQESDHGPEYAAPVFIGKYQKFAARKKFEDRDAQTNLWLITITDIMALMLTFFVLLYSMSSPREKQWEETVAALNNNFNAEYSPPQQDGMQDTVNIDKVDFGRATDLRYLRSVIEETLAHDETLKGVEIIAQRGRMILSLPQDMLFEPGRAEVNARGQQALFAIGGALSRIKNAIEVVGHADPRAIENNQTFRTNWDLSLARAMRVAGILENVGYPKPIAVRGMSSARYDDLDPAIPEARRLDLSRRVDIVILKDKGNIRAFYDVDP